MVKKNKRCFDCKYYRNQRAMENRITFSRRCITLFIKPVRRGTHTYYTYLYISTYLYDSVYYPPTCTMTMITITTISVRQFVCSVMCCAFQYIIVAARVYLYLYYIVMIPNHLVITMAMTGTVLHEGEKKTHTPAPFSTPHQPSNHHRRLVYKLCNILYRVIFKYGAHPNFHFT